MGKRLIMPSSKTRLGRRSVLAMGSFAWTETGIQPVLSSQL